MSASISGGVTPQRPRKTIPFNVSISANQTNFPILNVSGTGKLIALQLSSSANITNVTIVADGTTLINGAPGGGSSLAIGLLGFSGAQGGAYALAMVSFKNSLSITASTGAGGAAVLGVYEIE